MKNITLATVFSGIGSPEQALIRLGVPHKVLFACDNGERLIEVDYEAEMKHVKTLNTRKLQNTIKKGGCGECQTSCQSACKTSCTVGNQSCENNK